jgi:hypothetical protein
MTCGFSWITRNKYSGDLLISGHPLLGSELVKAVKLILSIHKDNSKEI